MRFSSFLFFCLLSAVFCATLPQKGVGQEAFGMLDHASEEIKPKIKPRSLPPLELSKAPGNRRLAQPTDPKASPLPSYAVIPTIPHPSPPKKEENPYEPTGVHAGAFRLFPYLGFSLGYHSNPLNATANPEGSMVQRFDMGTKIMSLWSQHELSADFNFSHTRYPDVRTGGQPEGNGKINLTFELSRDTALKLETRGTIQTQQPGSPETGSSAVDSPYIFNTGQTIGIAQSFNRLKWDLYGTVDRTTYQDGYDTNGTALFLSKNNYSDYGIGTKIGYEIDPTFTPYTRIDIDQRRRDIPEDGSGYLRDSKGIFVRAGIDVKTSEFLTQTISLGYIQRTYEDARLTPVKGPAINIAASWQATPLTKITLAGDTSVSETTVTGASGSLNQRISLEISHALLRNLVIGSVSSLELTRYKGADIKEKTLKERLFLDYSFNRYVVFQSSFTYGRFLSTQPHSDYSYSLILAGLRFQR